MDEGDYSNANWQRVLVEYENGKYAIAIADPQPESEDVSVINKAVQDTIYAALNTAIDRMNAIPVLVLPPIDVVVSMDAQTIGLGYMIKPTIVHTTKYTQASVVITDMIKQNIREKYGLTLDGYATYHESEPAGTYAYMNTGTTRTDFYLAQVYWPNQQNAKSHSTSSMSAVTRSPRRRSKTTSRASTWVSSTTTICLAGCTPSATLVTASFPPSPALVLRAGECATVKSCAGSSRSTATVLT